MSNINKTESENKTKVKPFVKWVGGKRAITSILFENLPKDFNNYYEPFVGGGALFFELYNLGLLKGKKVYLSDLNKELITTYKMIQNRLDELIKLLEKHKKNHDKDYFYKMRSYQKLTDDLEIAARFIYLNKTCFNGLYRVNSKGEFNTPMGRYKNPGIVQIENLKLVNKALQGVVIENKSFDKTNSNNGDFVYFDPPYDPLNKSSFKSYDKSGFNDSHQTSLRDVAKKLSNKGSYVMLSNSKTPMIDDLYKDKPFTLKYIHAPRKVNSKGSGRGDILESLIVTY